MYQPVEAMPLQIIIEIIHQQRTFNIQYFTNGQASIS